MIIRIQIRITEHQPLQNEQIVVYTLLVELETRGWGEMSIRHYGEGVRASVLPRVFREEVCILCCNLCLFVAEDRQYVQGNCTFLESGLFWLLSWRKQVEVS